MALRRLGPRVTAVLVAVAAATAVLPLAVPSAAQDGVSAKVDPDCLPPEEVQPAREEERDGVCPDEGARPPAPNPAPPADPEPTTPGPPKPVSPAPTAPAAQQGQADAGESARGGRGSGKPRRARRGAARKGRAKAQRRGGARRRKARRQARHRGSERHVRRGAGRRRAARRRGARPDRARRPVLGPIPGWARTLLSRPLPDPLPAGRRIDGRFARALQLAAARERVSWPLMLAVLRARGRDGPRPPDRRSCRGWRQGSPASAPVATRGARSRPSRALRARPPCRRSAPR